jgi:small redox-active disulfide protein 2
LIQKKKKHLVAINHQTFQTSNFSNQYYMNIQILGTGCPKCKTLEKLTREVVEQNGITAEISKVEDIMEIMKFNVMSTPAIVIDGKVVLKGRVPSASELKDILTNKVFMI